MKTIQLKQHGLGRYTDVSPFPLGDLEIELQGVPVFNGEYRFIAFCNGSKVSENTVTTSKNVVIISRDKLNAGRFSCYLSHYLKGMEVKRFPIEDLLISDVNSDIYAQPEIAVLEQNIRLLRQEVEREKQIRTQAVEQVKTSCQEILDRYNVAQELLFKTQRTLSVCLIKFAYKDYLENVYLESGTFDDFLKEFGFNFIEFSPEEIKFIKGE